MRKQGYLYIMTNRRNTTLYTGVTSDLTKRVYEHKEKFVDGFTKRYNLTKLVYYEVFEDIENAILREKQIKAGSRKKKIELINRVNEDWKELYEELPDGFAFASAWRPVYVIARPRRVGAEAIARLSLSKSQKPH